MNIFKSQETLIAEIHNEFDTAQDRLLVQADKLLKSLDIPTESSIEKTADRLKSLGFTSTPLVKRAEKLAESRNKSKEILVKTKEEAELIKYYKYNYPFLKFLTESELGRICDKYNLIYAPVGNYTQDVPVKNLKEIESAQKLKEEDSEETLYRFELAYKHLEKAEEKFLSLLGKKEPVFTRKELYTLVAQYNKYCAESWVPEDMSEFSNTSFWVISGSVGAEQNSYYNKFTTISKEGIFIAAPRDHFNLDGLLNKTKHGFFSVFETKVKDPIVFRYVRGGVQVLSKWGLEANDPALIVDTLN